MSLQSSKKRKFFFLSLMSLGSILIFCLFLEMVTPHVIGAFFPFLKRESMQEKVAQTISLGTNETAAPTMGQASEPDWASADLLHPYLGFVKKGEVFGFYNVTSVPKRQKDVLVVGIFGGSVAGGLCTYPDLLQQLSQIPRFENKKVQIICLALGGYKQPQQLLTLNYFLSIGAQFDVLINVDGFNELGLPYSDNFRGGITPYYPRLWNVYGQKSVNAELLPLIGQLTYLRKQKEQLSSFIKKPLMNKSYFILLIAYEWGKRIEQQEVRINQEILNTVSAGEKTPQLQGPEPSASKEQLFGRSIEVWRDSSVQMSLIAEGNGIEYYHFLQPNQYHRNSKVLNGEELQVAFVHDNDPTSVLVLQKESVEVGYPLLIKEGEKLKKIGVNFFDLTQVFSQVKETTYTDACCHYTRRGSELVIAAIIEKIREAQ
jgi:hypothetical protein